MKIKYILVIVLCALFTHLFAQTQQEEIRLLDLETAMPIVQATFEYGEQNGISDENGTIRFDFIENATLTISHMSYGSWLLYGNDLKIAIQNKVFYRNKETVNLYPVTIIGVKQQSSQPESRLNIEHQDRMEHDGAQLLNQLPAFNSIRKGGNYGFDPVFRGFKYDQLNIVFNGAQSATAACPNRMDPPTSQMAPNMIDRIEVLKGPYALRYGSGFGATINFVPTNLRFTIENDVYGRLSTGYESNGDIVRGESQIGFSGKKHDISFFGSWSQGNDYTSGNDETVQADFQRGSFGTNMGFKITSRQQLRISALYNRARDADFPALPMDLREDDTWMFNVRHDIQFNRAKLQSWNTTVFGSFVDHLMNNLLKPLDPRTLNAETAAKTFNYGGRTEGVWRFTKGTLYAGADLRIEGAEGTRLRAFLMGPNAGNTFEDNAWQDGRISKTGVFTEYQLNGSTFDYIFSGRLELNNAKVNDASGEFTQIYSDSRVTQVNPSFSVGILKDFGTTVKTGFWLGRAQRSGGLTERFINFFPVGQDPFEMLGNPDLNPEVNNQVDVTLQWTPYKKTKVNIDVFVSYLQDYISSVINPNFDPRLPSSPGVRQFINIDEVFKTGFEISWSQKLFAGLQHQLGIAYTYGQDMERDEPLPEIAPLDLRYVLSGSYFKNKLSPEIAFRYVAEQSRISNEFGETVTPSFTLLDINIGYEISDKLSINAGVNNLFDENYYEHLNRSVRGTNDPIFAPGRNVFANLNLTF
ncbi:TonB-dependent receptor [Winogradskyella sp.]|uniref:TonB-dependent receptor domain-containing protein n=1 Tax=Winogradskyella sp. TaxID=1883156 RepID=UPI00262DA5B5|nr:TonB-dependent receptor [Winogradskyella sp.]